MKGIGSQVAYKTLSKAKFWASRHTPEGLVVAGIVAFGATCYFVAKGSVEVEKAKKEYHGMKHVCKSAREMDLEPEQYGVVDRQEKEAKVAYAKTVVKCYTPAALCGVVAVSCFTGGHYILKKRNVALVAAYHAIDDSFKSYRKNVVEKYGEEEDIRLKNNLGVEKVTVTEVDEDGKKHKKKVDQEYLNGEVSEYSFIYDDRHCIADVSDPIMTMDRLKGAEKYADTTLKTRGYITLNEVLRGIGLEETSAGQIVGWTMKGNGDGYVDFGIRRIRSAKDDDGLAYILDFNVDGPIYDQIDNYTKRR